MKRITIHFICLTLSLTLVYLLLLFLLNIFSCGLTLNEFGDYVGGVLNPFFTLLSTTAIIYLTYFIASNEGKKADEAIAAQKRITLNQMRQAALDNLNNKLNLFLYDLDKIPVHDVKLGGFVQRSLTAKLKEDDKEHVIVWLIIQYELVSFLEPKHLFGDLFNSDKFQNVYNSIVEATSKLNEELRSTRMITSPSLEKYIETKQLLVTQIGDYILKEF